MQTLQIGRKSAPIASAGLGCMAFAGGYGPPDDVESIATIHAALDAGLALLDTGDFYGMGHNEMLLGEALKGGRRQRAFLSVKFGAMRGPDGVYSGFDARPLAVKNFLAYSLRRLKTDYVDRAGGGLWRAVARARQRGDARRGEVRWRNPFAHAALLGG
jgi:aryl-alcohol dehydrogenase-like predicted oxidoreductase